jgi:UPF0176 protein
LFFLKKWHYISRMTTEVLLYYLYTALDDPAAVVASQRELCQRLNLKGRIIVAEEGINGTVEGAPEDTEQYILAMTADPRFAGISFKHSVGNGAAFPKLSVKVRSEIVTTGLGEDDVDQRQQTGRYLSADELHQWINSDKDFTIVDMRNNYEHAVGHFSGSVLPKMRFFRQLPEVMPQLEPLRNKTVLTVCTGGVRCEKASAYLLKQGFSEVYQLEGGIATYLERYPNQGYKGKLYVFDSRIHVGYGSESADHEVIGCCEKCGLSCETYINCADDDCHRHFICCDSCQTGRETTYCGAPCVAPSLVPA